MSEQEQEPEVEQTSMSTVTNSTTEMIRDTQEAWPREGNADTQSVGKAPKVEQADIQAYQDPNETEQPAEQPAE